MLKPCTINPITAFFPRDQSLGNAVLLGPFSLPFKNIGTISAFSGLLRLLSCPNVSEHSFIISSLKNLPCQIQSWIKKFGNCHLTCSFRTARLRSNCVQCLTSTKGHFVCNGKDILKVHHFKNTSHFHLFLYSYYYWFQPLIASLYVYFICFFLTQIPPFIYLFSESAFIYPPNQGEAFLKLIWVSLYSGTVLWQTWLKSLQIPSLFSSLNVFPPHWCVNIWLYEISVLKD